MRTSNAVLGLVAASVLLAGCTGPKQSGGETTEPQASKSASSQASESAPPTRTTESAPALTTDPDTGQKVETDEAGRVKKALGQTGTLTTADGKTSDFSISVKKSSRQKSCTMRGFGDELKPKNGQFIELTVEAKLDPSAGNTTVPLDASAFVPVDSDGRATGTNAWSEEAEGCEIQSPLDVMATAGHTSSGSVMLDVPQGTTAIAFDPDGTPGWVWTLKN
ncbi:MAG: hypothetical protein ACTIJJ_05720 [Galactobacter sp.]|uniref:hypothetical protein n=1 Tax=Galactobacter sp. TaxID=2676125 RepID=UPI0025C5D2F4|nr:hypothetical protein [Galactobacter sp.]